MTPFSYVILRIVPSVERGECVNVGVVLFCRQQRYLGMLSLVDPGRLSALAPGVALADIRAHLDALHRVADGDAAAGPIAELDQSERFGWLAAPSSTIVQASAAHTGLCRTPATTLQGLFDRLVAPPAAPPPAAGPA